MVNNCDSPSSGTSLAKQAKTSFGATTLLVLAVALFYAAVALWPPDFLDTAFGQMTLNMLFRFGGAFSLFVIGLVVVVFSAAMFYSLSSSAQEVTFQDAAFAFVLKLVFWVIVIGLLWYMAKVFAR